MKDLLIIGAKSDMAQAVAKIYAEQGYAIRLAARQSDDLAPLAKDLEIRYQSKVSLYELNVCNAAQRSEFVESLEGLPSTVLVAAGYLGDQELAQQNDAECATIFDVNMMSAISLLNHFANEFEQRKSGSIIAITSVAGDRGRKSNYMYGASKAGLINYLSGLRNRLFESNVTVLDVRPGFVATKMTAHLELPEKLTSSPEAVAKSIYAADHKGKDVIYVSGVWRLIMLIIKSIPEFVFKRLSL